MDRVAGLIILDRDGVLNQTLPNPHEPRPDSPLRVEDVVVFPWVPAVLRSLTCAGYRLAIATNQPAFAKGKVALEMLDRVHARVIDEITRDGARISSSHICLHRAEDGCECRKPKPKLLFDALARHPGLDIGQSWMVGDRATDVLAGAAAGVRTALLGDATGAESEALARALIQPSFCGADLRDFCRFLLGPVGSSTVQSLPF
jgi:D-glycero-D-manno-heptose 1,7-bisphosphate phosphatase